MPDEALEVAEKSGAAGVRILVGVAEDGARLEKSIEAEREGDRGSEDEGLAGREAFRDEAGGKVGDDEGDVSKDHPEGAEAAGHELFLTDEADEAGVGRQHEAEGDHGQKHSDDEA